MRLTNQTITMRSLLASAFFSLSLMWSGCSASETTSPEGLAPEPDVVDIGQAEHFLFQRSHLATGTIRGANTITLTSRVVGQILELPVAPGEHVEAGQLLAVLDDNTARAGLREAQAGVREASAARVQYQHNREAAEAAWRIAETTRDRVFRLREEGAVSQQRLDEAQAAYGAANARYRAAGAGIDRAGSMISQAGAAARIARTALDYTRLHAPFSGLVLERPAHLGDLIAPGTPLLTVEADESLRAEVAVPESFFRRLQMGAPLSVEVDASGLVLEGTIAEIIPTVESRSRTFAIKIDLPENEALRSGMFVRVPIPTETEEGVRIPRSAISSRGSLDRVFVVQDGKARLRLVTVGVTVEDFVEVLSGLAGNESVVLNPPRRLLDGASVTVRAPL